MGCVSGDGREELEGRRARASLDDVDEEVEDLGLLDRGLDVLLLQRAALVLLRVAPRAQREL